MRDNIAQFLITVSSGWGKDIGGNNYTVLDTKGGRGLYALCSSSQKGEKVEACRSKVHISGKLDQARLLKKLAKCEIRELM